MYQITTRHHNSHSLTLSPHQHQRLLSKPQRPNEFIVWARYVFIIDCMFLINLYYLVFVYDTMDHHHIRRHVTDKRQTTGNLDTTTTARNEEQRDLWEAGGPKPGQTSRLGPGMFFFFFFSFFFTNMYIFYTSLGPQTHPRYKSESVGRYYFSFTHTDPPSLQMRVGGPSLLIFYTYGPTSP